MRAALGLIESVGLTTAITALDAASKAADVELVGYEKVIGVGKIVSVTIQLGGEVAAVKAAVEAGVQAANRVGNVVSSHVIPRPHEEVDNLIKEFQKDIKDLNEEDKKDTKDTKKQKKSKSDSKEKETKK
ncbi:BMC domain-containing protein [Dethiothermospora halolimnae]|uniref:BMC domain-containing protein n=1 Tax=Dethiothermospora halolimnae TaxID=3114390 RepID=UPI003CCBA5EA